MTKHPKRPVKNINQTLTKSTIVVTQRKCLVSKGSVFIYVHDTRSFLQKLSLTATARNGEFEGRF